MNIRVFIYLQNDEFRHILQLLHGDSCGIVSKFRKNFYICYIKNLGIGGDGWV